MLQIKNGVISVNYSVLMSVYCKEKPEYLRESLESMFNQTLKTNDFVLVLDGPLTDELYDVIDKFKNEYRSILNVVQLDKNVGIGLAAGIGLKHCKNDLIAKMDADDVSLPRRCEKQIKLFEKDPSLSLVGSYLSEFVDSIGNVVSVRKVPLTHNEILEYAKRRSPFNNQSVMYRKSVVESVGGYSSLKRSEDYELFVRILSRGFKTANMDESLVYFRLNNDSYKRKGTIDNLAGFINVRWKIYKMGFSSFWDFLIPTIGQLAICIVPVSIRKKIYNKYLRG